MLNEILALVKSMGVLQLTSTEVGFHPSFILCKVFLMELKLTWLFYYVACVPKNPKEPCTPMGEMLIG